MVTPSLSHRSPIGGNGSGGAQGPNGLTPPPPPHYVNAPRWVMHNRPPQHQHRDDRTLEEEEDEDEDKVHEGGSSMTTTQPRLRLKLNRHGRCGDGPTFWGMWEDERSRMVYVSWLPRAARAGDRSEKKKCELALKEFITRTLGFSGLQKVLLFPPSSAHCKLLFGSEQAALRFLATFGGMEGDAGPTLWKSLVCEYFSVNIRGGIHATRVRIIWADQTKNDAAVAFQPPSTTTAI